MPCKHNTQQTQRFRVITYWPAPCNMTRSMACSIPTAPARAQLVLAPGLLIYYLLR